MKTKYLCRLWMLIMALLLPAIASAHDFEVDGIYYSKLSSTEVQVTYRGNSSSSYSNEYTGSVEIPESVTYSGTSYSVTLIGDYAFRDCSGLTSVNIPNSVTSIGKYAFSGCSGLTGTLTIPNSVTSIGDYAFSGCSGLTGTLTIPNSITSIGNYAFYGCSGLTGTLTIPNSVTSIGYSAFSGCSGLTSVTIPNSVTSIGSAFSGCSGLTSVTIPNSVTSIGNSFSGCSGLTSVTIPNSVTSIGGSAFKDCSGLTSLTIPNSVTSIDSEAFKGCSGLTSLTIGNSVTSIGYDAFSFCSRLKEVTIEDGSKTLSFGENVFTVAPIETLYLGRNFTYSSSDRYSDQPFKGKTSLSNLTIGNSVTWIGNYAFSGCSGLKEVSIEDGSETLSFGYSIFSNVPIETLYLGRNFTCTSSSASNQPFRGKTSLSSLTIGSSVTSISDYAFIDCSGLKEVILEDGSKTLSFGSYVFDGVPIKTLYLGRNFASGSSNPFSGKTSLSNLTIGNSVTSIYYYAFYGCSRLTSLTIGNSVTSIGYDAFEGCSGLTSLTIPNSVTKIGSSAF
ncbi:MAG: leucine-rich repeat domain-containing protein, partial [Muribaculaceae bacterium]|nr:leucine-rich repeat domain-containing protein [Muribaculaceae bacterium]